jgi:hypothetical protein
MLAQMAVIALRVTLAVDFGKVSAGQFFHGTHGLLLVALSGSVVLPTARSQLS